ncbi:hypothetical protein [Lampropedia aestuarii]|uniref:hypothetical protein n=1 Tax=Lampropedia aestuarii TaxID=2562762 RepID=UPI002469A934|nr:hypothetical protein [Lampropedia aestuarii]MDH5859271.1 hypothetical protein [Lampropedia aestuarii]
MTACDRNLADFSKKDNVSGFGLSIKKISLEVWMEYNIFPNAGSNADYCIPRSPGEFSMNELFNIRW